MTSSAAEDETVESAEPSAQDRLAKKFPHWRIWRSSADCWYATLRLDAPSHATCDRTVHADTPAVLSRKLDEQEQEAARAAS